MANSSRDAVDNQSRGISEAEQAAAKAVRTAINTKKAVKTVKIVKKYGFKGDCSCAVCMCPHAACHDM